MRKDYKYVYLSQILTYVPHVVRGSQLESRMTPTATVTYTALYRHR
jgi:hypothetical protein